MMNYNKRRGVVPLGDNDDDMLVGY